MKHFIRQLVYPLTVIFLIGLSNQVLAGKPTTKKPSDLANATAYSWYDGVQRKTIWLDPNLLAEFDPKPADHPQVTALAASATPLKNGHAMRLWRLKPGISAKAAEQQLRQQLPAGKISPVWHDGASTTSRKRALPGNIIVHLNPDWDTQQVNQWFRQHSLVVVKPLPIGPNIFVVKTDPGLAALDKANALYLSGEVVAAYPNWWVEVQKK